MEWDKSLPVHHLYIRHAKDGSLLILIFLVNDMLIINRHLEEISSFKSKIAKSFDHTRYAYPKIKEIYLFVSNIVYWYGMVFTSLLASYVKLWKKDWSLSKKDKVKMENVPCFPMVISLMYAMICTRLDIALQSGSG